MAAIPVPVAFDPRRAAPRPLQLVPPARHRPTMAAVYRRRRIAVGLVGVVLLAAVFVAGRAAVAPRAPSPRGAFGTEVLTSRRVVTVEPGDTLWSIARSLGGRGDVRATVDRLAAIHGTGPLRVGERLVLPSADASR